MAIDRSAAQTATDSLKALPFEAMIGGPLEACIKAQSAAAKATIEFIQQVGMTEDPVTHEKKALNISFSFIQGGRMVQLNVPLLTIVPIPFIAIHSIDINFKANISASSSSVAEDTRHDESGGSVKASASGGWAFAKASTQMNANYSSKKDSKATQESKYSVEYTMDVAVRAGQDSMPAGLAKILELLGNALEVSSPLGVLEVSARELEAEETLYISYKNKDGLFAPKEVKVKKGADEYTIADEAYSEDQIALKLTDVAEYTITAGEQKMTVNVKAKTQS